VRPPRNPAERAFWDAATAAGWEPAKRGWPDFICFRGGEVCVVEVKPKRRTRLKVTQARVLVALARAGIPAYHWSPDAGFRRIQPTTETPPAGSS